MAVFSREVNDNGRVLPRAENSMVCLATITKVSFSLQSKTFLLYRNSFKYKPKQQVNAEKPVPNWRTTQNTLPICSSKVTSNDFVLFLKLLSYY
ncbi:hypothetical protein ACU8KH_05475 [Lachancea thermotolerans]